MSENIVKTLTNDDAEKTLKRTAEGKVVSSKMNQSVTVLIERTEKDPRYGKFVKKSTKLMAHDPENSCSEGDLVRIEECRPISKHKSWKVLKVLEKATS